jgi:transposase-like protein
MFGRETRMLLRHYLEQGTSKSALARQLGVHRDTIHRWIRDGELDRDLDRELVRYGPRRPRPNWMRINRLSKRGSRPIRSCRPYGS